MRVFIIICIKKCEWFCAAVSMFLYNVVLAEHYMDNLSGNNGALSYIKLLICPAVCGSSLLSRCSYTIICWTAHNCEMLWRGAFTLLKVPTSVPYELFYVIIPISCLLTVG